MSENPLISVVIPTHNEEGYIEDLLKSIKAQTYKNYEIIVGDYKSTDNTIKIARRYVARIIRTKKRGISIGRNIALKAARGDIIAFIDSDYILSKTLFNSAVKALTAKRGLVCVEPSLRVNTKDMPRRRRLEFKVLSRLINLYKRLSFYSALPAAYSCDFCISWAIKRAGKFNENIHIGEDKEFFSRLRKYGRFKMLKDTARMSYRRHIAHGTIRTGLLYFYSVIVRSITGKFKVHHVPVRLRTKSAHR